MNSATQSTTAVRAKHANANQKSEVMVESSLTFFNSMVGPKSREQRVIPLVRMLSCANSYRVAPPCQQSDFSKKHRAAGPCDGLGHRSFATVGLSTVCQKADPGARGMLEFTRTQALHYWPVCANPWVMQSGIPASDLPFPTSPEIIFTNWPEALIALI